MSNSVVALGAAQAAAGAHVWIATNSCGQQLYGELPTGDALLCKWSGRPRVGRGAMRVHFLRRTSIRSLREIEPDIVHVHGEFNPDNWWAPRLWRCPLVLSPHGAFHAAVLTRGARRKRLYIRIANRLLYQRACFHALSPSESRDIGATFSNAPIYCLPQGPTPAVSKVADRVNGDMKPGDAPVKLLFVGRLDVRTKGLDVMLQAFSKIRHDVAMPSAELSIVGPDWRSGRSQLRGLARRLDIEDTVILGERVPQTEVPALLRRCDIYVQLSRHEGSPLSLNDALVLGKPVIVSDQVGTISYGEIANLSHVKVVSPTVADAAGAMAEAVENIRELTLAARQARPALEAFLSWERVAGLHIQRYESLIGNAFAKEPKRSRPTLRGTVR